MTITHIWIEEGCIACGACPVTCPQVFAIPDDYDEAVIVATARCDGRTSPNRDERSPLTADIREHYQDLLHEAADGCPVEVIRFHRA